MPKMKARGRGSVFRIQLMTAVFVLLFAILVRMVWPDGVRKLQSVLLPQEVGITEAAFADMMMDLREGQTMENAVTAFCRQVIDSAKVSD